MGTVQDLIDRLSRFDKDMVVCLGDWNEQYSDATEDEAEVVFENHSFYYPADGDEMVSGIFIQIGNGK